MPTFMVTFVPEHFFISGISQLLLTKFSTNILDQIFLGLFLPKILILTHKFSLTENFFTHYDSFFCPVWPRKTIWITRFCKCFDKLCWNVVFHQHQILTPIPDTKIRRKICWYWYRYAFQVSVLVSVWNGNPISVFVWFIGIGMIWYKC